MSVLREMARKGLSISTSLWRPYSRIFMVSDSASWVISWEIKEIARIAQKLGKRLAPPLLLPFTDLQSVFFGDHFELLLTEKWFQRNCRYGVAYFHGRPGQGLPEFDTCFKNLQKHHEQIQRLQVSHEAMREVVLSAGIAPDKVFLIPIGINLSYFKPRTTELRRRARKKHNVPDDAVVVGSFQKDGVGWGKGMEPKWPKGPEVFLNAIAILKEHIPKLFVLLSGPARGFVKEGLRKMNVPYYHSFLKNYPDIASLYHCLDVYIVASREEGGPKAVLESMACGVPLVTTRVGQAEDLVRHGQNGWMVDVGDAEGLAAGAVHCLNNFEERAQIVAAGLVTAERNSYESQLPVWSKFFQGFVA